MIRYETRLFESSLKITVDLYIYLIVIYALQQAGNKAPAFQFTSAIEIAVFKETINLIPFHYERTKANQVWAQIAENVMLAMGLDQVLTGQTAKGKVEARIKNFKSKNKELIKK